MYKTIIFAHILLFSFSLQARFVPVLVSQSTVHPTFKMKFALAHGIEHVVYKDLISPQNYDDLKKESIRIVFPNLSQNQFNLLWERFDKTSSIKWIEGKEYRLTDFLPPKIQALSDHWLSGTSEAEPRIPESWRNPYDNFGVPYVSVNMNCWTTAWEVVRDWGAKHQELRIGYFDGPTASKYLEDSEYHSITEKLLSREEIFNEKLADERNEGRRPGDLLIIHTIGSLDISPAHVAVWIDDDLYFEKTNSGGHDPIRLSTYTMATDSYKEQDDEYFPITFKFVRTIGATESLPDQRELGKQNVFDFDPDQTQELLPPELSDLRFSLDVGMGGSMKEYGVNRFKTVPVILNRQGKGEIPEGMKYLGVTDLACQTMVFDGDEVDPFFKVNQKGQLFRYNAQGKLQEEVQGHFSFEKKKLPMTDYFGEQKVKDMIVLFQAKLKNGKPFFIITEHRDSSEFYIFYNNQNSSADCTLDRADAISLFGTGNSKNINKD